MHSLEKLKTKNDEAAVYIRFTPKELAEYREKLIAETEARLAAKMDIKEVCRRNLLASYLRQMHFIMHTHRKEGELLEAAKIVESTVPKDVE